MICAVTAARNDLEKGGKTNDQHSPFSNSLTSELPSGSKASGKDELAHSESSDGRRVRRNACC